MTRAFKTLTFNKWATKNRITDQMLNAVVTDIRKGLIDVDLGHYLIKQRIAIGNRGKSSGARIIIGTNKTNYYFFIYGFKKNELYNIAKEDEMLLREMAKKYFKLSSEQVACAIKQGELTEVIYEEETI